MVEYIDITLDRDDLNQRIGNGLPKGSLMIIEGEDGSGKSILSQRIIYGALLNGYKVTYISTEMTTLDFIKQMKSLRYDIEDFILSNKLIFISLINLFGKIKKEENLIFELKKEKSKKLFESDIIIIDSLSYPLIKDLNEDQVYDLLDFLLKVKSKDKIIILTYNPNNINQILINNLRRVSDIYFKTYQSSLAGQITKVIEIIRLRDAKEEYQQIIPYRVEPGLGLLVEIISVA